MKEKTKERGQQLGHEESLWNKIRKMEKKKMRKNFDFYHILLGTRDGSHGTP